MPSLQDKSRSNCNSKTFNEDRGIGINSKDDDKILIFKANSFNLLEILNSYQIDIDEYNRKIICPIPSHKLERTASFVYYKDTNSFYCFGCKNGGGPCNFISLMDGISKIQAADRINNGSFSKVKIVKDDDYFKCNKIIFDFSSTIREFIQSNADDPAAVLYAEKLTSIFDMMIVKHKLDTNGLSSLIDKLKLKIKHFKV